MRCLWWLVAAPLCAHTISMSNGDFQIHGARAEFQLRMPAYETSHMQNPSDQLFRSFRFSSGGVEAKLVQKHCHDSPPDGMFVCDGTYEFSKSVEILEVECRLARITVPSHVHLLRARRDGKMDQAMFDVSFENAELRFRPPTAFETAVRQMVAGMLRAGTAAAGILFLFALALGSRSWRELGLLAAAFLGGEALACLIGWSPAPRFVDAAMGLSVAYLAVEIVFLPSASGRWAVSAVLGIFHGFYFAQFIRSTEFRVAWVLSGAAAIQLGTLFLFWMLVQRMGNLRRYAAMLLAATGIFWFLWRTFTG